jgi:hypothetical protein
MARRVLCLFALLCVADAITVHGRAPRAISLAQPEAGETARAGRRVAA